MVAMDTGARDLWHQLDNESDRAYAAFKGYLYIAPADRTLVRAWRVWSQNPEAEREPPYFREWFFNHAWSDRARAHDHHIEVIRERAMEKAIEEEAANQARQAERVRGRFYELMAITYERAITYLEDDSFVEQLRPADVVQILRVHLETIQKLGDPASHAADSVVDLSEDELRELDRIVDEIESENAQEESSEDGEEGSEEAEGEQD
jgi:hypothetical protein